MLLLGSLHPVLALSFSWLAEWMLALCGRIVHAADRILGGSVYLPAPPGWWVAGFYLLWIALILFPRDWRKLVLALIGWLAVLCVMAIRPATGDELRVTFLAVGHGGCTIIECPDGRVLVSDVGTLAGPDAVKRSVAPYLWHRGIRRVDELFLSHADLDHFNGIPELLRRFPVGQVTLTPSFSEKPTAEVAMALAAIRKANVPIHIAVAGDRFDAGGAIIETLHPPPMGPTGSENERSLVLKVTHIGHSILLTGDLEKHGTTLVTATPIEPIDVLMAPHHGSRGAWTPGFVAWAKPAFVVVSRGSRATGITSANANINAPIWDTQSFGAITIRSHATGLTAESFRSNDRVIVKRGSK
jgi:competence protein ComEC